MYNLLRVIGFALSIWLVAALFIVVFTAAAGAHDWYDRDCCDTKDCTPVIRMEHKPNGDTILYTKMFQPITVKQSWWAEANSGQYKRIRPSQDSGYHVCAIQFQNDSFERHDEIRKGAAHFVRCLYVPAGG